MVGAGGGECNNCKYTDLDKMNNVHMIPEIPYIFITCHTFHHLGTVEE